MFGFPFEILTTPSDYFLYSKGSKGGPNLNFVQRHRSCQKSVGADASSYTHVLIPARYGNSSTWYRNPGIRTSGIRIGPAWYRNLGIRISPTRSRIPGIRTLDIIGPIRYRIPTNL